MVVRLCCLLMVFVILIARISCSDVLDLDLANFEKLTKVASGHTTGDWLVKFYAPWCEHSQNMAPILEQAATELLGAVTVARVDVMNNRDIGTRFSIEGFPTLVLFSQGHMYTFKGRRTVEEVVEFARGGFQLHEPVATPWETALFRELILVSRHAYKEATRDLLEGNLYTINVFCIALPIIFGLLLFIVFFIPFSKPDHRQPLEFPADDVRSDIPVSRRARQPTSSTDTYLRKSTKGD